MYFLITRLPDNFNQEAFFSKNGIRMHKLNFNCHIGGLECTILQISSCSQNVSTFFLSFMHRIYTISLTLRVQSFITTKQYIIRIKQLYGRQITITWATIRDWGQ